MNQCREWLFKGDSFICDLRAVGVLVRDEKVLLQREKAGSEYALPGGHVKIGETTEEALIREYIEETGSEMTIRRLLWTEECFWERNGRNAHNIAFYYLIEPKNEASISDLETLGSLKDNANVILEWVPINRLQELTIYPSFLHKEILRLDGEIKHFVTRA